MTDEQSVGLVGLGLMGSAMAGRLLAAGIMVHGFDPDSTAAAAHEARGGRVCGTAADVASRTQTVILSLPTGAIAESVLTGDGGMAAAATAGTIFVDTTTASPEEAIHLARSLATTFDVRYCDVGLSGSSDMVARGDTLGMVGGDEEDFATILPVLKAFCREAMYVGQHGDGRRSKLVINSVLGVNRFALAEGLVLAETMGMNLELVLKVLQSSAAYSKAMDMWGPRMVDRHYTNPNSMVRNHNKGAVLTLERARHFGAPMPTMSQVNQAVQVLLAHGMGDADNAAIIEVLRMMAGIAPVKWNEAPST